MRKQIAKFEGFIALYLIVALLLTAILAIVFAVHVHFGLSIAIGVLYFVGLRFVIVKIKEKQMEEVLKI